MAHRLLIHDEMQILQALFVDSRGPDIRSTASRGARALKHGVAALGAALLATAASSDARATVDNETLGGPHGVHTEATGAGIASLALANVGKHACSTNSAGGTAYETSCTGNGGAPEYWCADFAMWVWATAGVSTISGLTAASGSFYVYGQTNGTLSNTPAVGDAVVFDYQGGGVAEHVAIVTQVNADGTIETVSGDWGGTGSSEAAFASTSSVVLNSPAYAGTVGTTPSVMAMTISGFIAPVGVSADYAAAYVSQSFPLATTALKMTAGETVASYIEMKNVGGKEWDSNTYLGTSEPRDRVSLFADGTWPATDRPARVSGTVAVGGTYKFEFNLHAPATPGTYYEYFNLLEDGVAWFSDPGQGGPADNDLEVQIVVEAAPPPPVDAGAIADAEVKDASSHPADAKGGDASEEMNDAAAVGSTANSDASQDAEGTAPGRTEADGGGTGPSASPPSGCNLHSRKTPGTPWAGLGILASLMVLRRRRQRRRGDDRGTRSE